jgi:hypothetical protein
MPQFSEDVVIGCTLTDFRRAACDSGSMSENRLGFDGMEPVGLVCDFCPRDSATKAFRLTECSVKPRLAEGTTIRIEGVNCIRVRRAHGVGT